MHYKVWSLLAVAVLSVTNAFAQGSTFVPLNPDVYRLIERNDIKYGHKFRELHVGVRPLQRSVVARLAEIAAEDSAGLSRTEEFNVNYLLNDNWDYTEQENNESSKPFLKHFYKNRTDLFSYESPEKDFSLRVNPVILFQGGKDSKTDGTLYVNTRGVQVEGTLDKKLGFYAFMADNQAVFPDYVNARIQRDTIVPHESYWKNFKENGYDFFTARGYVTFQATKHIGLQFGHDQNFIGNGYRSLVLSDYAPPAFFLKINTRVWKLNYQNLFTELIADHERRDQLYPKKYMAMHHLSINLLPNLNVGVFESVVFARDKGRFELQYLNPIIFYRGVEQLLGSEDNALLGADFKWNIKQRGQLYGQLVLDEFLLKEIKAGNGWWANKQAYQIGAKYIDVAGVSNLDLQAEFNYIRPYTYSHDTRYASFTHYQQPLAHPIGANVSELIGIVRYQPLPRLTLTGKAIYSKYGLDERQPDGTFTNWGTNPILPNTTREQDYNNEVGQGNTVKVAHLDFTASYQLKYNMFLDFKQIIRKADQLRGINRQDAFFTSVAFRWNIQQRLHEF